MEGLSNEMVPDVSDLSSKFENVETQTDLTEHEAYLTEIIDNNNKRNKKLMNLSVICKIPSGGMMPLIRDCLPSKP